MPLLTAALYLPILKRIFCRWSRSKALASESSRHCFSLVLKVTPLCCVGYSLCKLDCLCFVYGSSFLGYFLRNRPKTAVQVLLFFKKTNIPTKLTTKPARRYSLKEKGEALASPF